MGEIFFMKKSVITFLIMFVLAGMFVFSAPQSVGAQTYYRKVYRNGRVVWVRTAKPSYYRRHRNRINMAVGTGAGALVGGLIGGRKGMAIGANTGAAFRCGPFFHRNWTYFDHFHCFLSDSKSNSARYFCQSRPGHAA